MMKLNRHKARLAVVLTILLGASSIAMASASFIPTGSIVNKTNDTLNISTNTFLGDYNYETNFPQTLYSEATQDYQMSINKAVPAAGDEQDIWYTSSSSNSSCGFKFVYDGSRETITANNQTSSNDPIVCSVGADGLTLIISSGSNPKESNAH